MEYDAAQVCTSEPGLVQLQSISTIYNSSNSV